jgi:drug/metabolite transporter (DMT)-like permease
MAKEPSKSIQQLFNSLQDNPRTYWFASISMGCLGNILTLLLYGFTSVQAVQLLRCLSPLIAASLSTLILRETPTMSTMAALVSIVAGVSLIAWKVRRKFMWHKIVMRSNSYSRDSSMK